MSQALYRKYRSKSLDELVGQDHIVRALSASIKSGKISHAYLFTGPRGTGKTSVARILAYELNGIAYDENATNIDIIEIDAASNRRIDEIRDLREKVNIAPTSLKYKVYIIDEVHMLTKEAFNALLKTLEEPPEYVIFILATTELHKVPDTIISRTQRYAFRPIEQSKIVGHLKNIADSEKIIYDEDALYAIADHAEGGFRDAIGLLDQVRHTSDTVSVESVMDALGVPPTTALDTLWQTIVGNSEDATIQLQELYSAGFHAPLIAKGLLQRAVRDSRVKLAHQLLNVGASFDPKTELLLIALKESNSVAQEDTPAPSSKAPVSKPERQVLTQAVTQTNAQEITKDEPDPTILSEPVAQDLAVSTSVEPKETWEKILELIKQGGHSVYGPLRLAEANIENDILKLGLAFPFHIKRINDQKNLDVIYSAIKEVTGKEYQIQVHRVERDDNKPAERIITKPKPIIEERPEPPLKDDPDAELMTDPLSIVKNVFGGAEIL